MNNTHKEFDMNNMRKGFTMIELIFVIVIIGILAAVAIPKLAGTATEAKKGNYTSFIATMNRTVGPSMWSANIASNGGSIKTISQADFKDAYMELPAGVTLDFARCADTPADIGDIAEGTGLPNAEDIYCIDGTSTTAPKFGFDNIGTTDVNTSLQNN